MELNKILNQVVILSEKHTPTLLKDLLLEWEKRNLKLLNDNCLLSDVKQEIISLPTCLTHSVVAYDLENKIVFKKILYTKSINKEEK